MCPPPSYQLASSASTTALAMASMPPVKNLVSVLRFGGSKIFLLEEGDPSTPIRPGSQPRSAAFHTVLGFERLHDVERSRIPRGLSLLHTVMSAGSLTFDSLIPVWKHSAADGVTVLDADFVDQRDLRNTQESGNDGTGLSRFSVRRVTSANQQVVVAQLFRGLGERISGCQRVRAPPRARSLRSTDSSQPMARPFSARRRPGEAPC